MNNLKELREKANLTQESLAKLINVDRSTIAKWETGEHRQEVISCRHLQMY